MAFHVLHPDLARHLLEGEVDELTPLNTARIDKIKRTPCPRCGASLHPKLNTRSLFSEHSPLPRLLATCECGFEMDSESGLIVDRGSAAKVEDPLPIIRVKD
jgi:RNase P subunit RPR2